MSEPAAARARDEAAAWFARLSQLSVTTDALKAFREWRRDAANAAAYAEVEATWEAAGRLSVDADIRAATREALAQRPARRGVFRDRPRLRLALGAVTLLIAALVALFLFYAARGLSYGTRVGEQRLIVLEDGSRVRLNTDSGIQVRLGKTERLVRLTRGQAFFEVAHDAGRPFLVEAGPARVQALGTRFDVWRQPDQVRVTLLEGRVQVRQSAAGAEALLTPHQQLTVTARGLGPARAADEALVASWTTGRLVFHGTPLEAAVAEVNRYSRRQITLDAPNLARQPVSGVFDIGDTEGFVGAVSTLFSLRAEREGSSLRLTSAPRAGS